LIEQGGVSIDGERVSDGNALLPQNDFVLAKGKKVRLKIVRK